MTACRDDGAAVRRPARAAAAILVLTALAAGPAAAQLGPPIRLGPPPAGAAGDGETSGATAAPLLAPVPRSDPPIEREALPPLAAPEDPPSPAQAAAPAAAGIAAPGPAAEPAAAPAPAPPSPAPPSPAPPVPAPAATAAATPAAPAAPPQGTAIPGPAAPGTAMPAAPAAPAAAEARSALAPILAQLPLRIAAPATRALVLRTLAEGGGPAGPRAARMLAMGDVAGAAALAQRGAAADEALQRVRLDLMLLADDVAAACTLTRAQAAVTATPAWTRALVFCQLRDRESDNADLGLRMLGDATTPEDAVFVQLALAMAAGQRPTLDIVREPSPLLLAMMRAGGAPLPAATLDSASPAILGSVARAPLATGPAAAAAQRLAAADRAEAFGALDTRTLLQVYDAVSYSARETTGLAEVAENDRGPRGRAALARLVKAAGDDDARAVALQLLWRTGRERGFYPQAARMGLPALLAMTPRPRLAAFAPDAARAALIAGQAEAAQRWAAAAARDDQDLLWPVLRAAGLDRPARPLDDGIEAWRRAASARDAGFARTRLDVVRAVLAASDAAGEPATRRTAPRVAGPPPAEGEMQAALAAAVAANRRDEAALQAARILLASPGAGAIATVVRALGTIGRRGDARAVAAEALLAAGL